MSIGLLTGVLSGVVWGLIFIAPMALPDYSAVQLTWGRYFSFGVVTVFFLLWGGVWKKVLLLSKRDWFKALELTLWGNILYYLVISIAVQRIGGALTGAFIGLLPLLVSIISNIQAGQQKISWRRLSPALLLLLMGLGLLYREELAQINQLLNRGTEVWIGTICAILALSSWTIYALRNANYLKNHPQIDNAQWTAAQGLVTLLLMLLALPIILGVIPAHAPPNLHNGHYWAWMLALGLCASWLGLWFWNITARHLPTMIAGQMIVFETIFAFLYSFIFRGVMPNALTFLGMFLLIAGVCWGLMIIHTHDHKGASAP